MTFWGLSMYPSIHNLSIYISYNIGSVYIYKSVWMKLVLNQVLKILYDTFLD